MILQNLFIPLFSFCLIEKPQESSLSRLMMAISLGDKVEVRFQEDGFQGSYFVAKVLNKNSKRCLVEYTTLVTEKNHKEFLKEVVEADRVRPLPPEIKVSSFDMYEKVDVYDNDGWWEGRVSGKYGSNYSVLFEHFGASETHHVSRLRPHQDYVDGKWITSRVA